MQFKHPELFWALFLLLIPIIVHLFQLRRFEKVWFTNVAFLKEIKLQTRKSATLKKWLTLITRLLILTCLIIAFAEPFFPVKKSNDTKAEKEMVIYLDNSFSMQAKGKKGPLFQRAVQDIIANSSSSSKFSLFTNTNTYTNTNLGNLQNTLLSLPYSNNQLSYNEAYLKGVSLFSNKANTAKEFIFISDFQSKNKPLNIEQQPNINTHFVQVTPENLQNISIDTLYISKNTEGIIELTSKISAEKPVDNSTVSLFNGEKIQAKTATNIPASLHSIAIFTIPDQSNFSGYISLNDDGLQYDNTLYFSIQKPEKINVLSINGAECTGNYIKKIFNDAEYVFEEQNVANINYNSINTQNLIILNLVDDISTGLITTLQTFVKNGGSVVIIPSANSNIASFNNLLAATQIAFDNKASLDLDKNITTINFSHPLFKDTFEKSVDNFQYPKVSMFYKLSGANNALTLEDGNAFLTSDHNFYVFATPLTNAYTNFQEYRDLTIPVFNNIAHNSLKLPTLYYTIGKEHTIDVKTQLPEDNVLEIKGVNTQFIPLQESSPNKISITTTNLPETSGNYTINHKENIIYPISYNYNRTESNLNYYRLSDYKIIPDTNLTTLFNELKSENNDSKLWKWFVIFALLFLSVEMLILKFLK